jgi:serine/threonine-protein kinase
LGAASKLGAASITGDPLRQPATCSSSDQARRNPEPRTIKSALDTDSAHQDTTMKEHLSEAPQHEGTELLEPVHESPPPEIIDDTKSSPSAALHAVHRQLTNMNAALTELQIASERRETTALMLERLNAEWDVLEARLKVLAKTAVDYDQWTRRPVEAAHERLHKLLAGGIGCGMQATQQPSEQRRFLEQLRRLAKRLLINWDMNQKRRDAATRTEDLTGRNLGGFILRRRIAAGGFGAVYGCEQPLLGREAVVKVLHRELRRSDVIVRRFLREARLASQFDHPYAAHIYAFGIEEQDRILWIAMERVQGVTLTGWLKLHGPMPLGQFVPFFEHLSAVVQTAHDRGIVHRDLKPANVMVIERAGELLPKLLDFGIAKLLDNTNRPEEMLAINCPLLLATEDSADNPVTAVRPPDKSTVSDDPEPSHPDDGRLTQDNHTVGSPPYIPPEQWSNAVTVGPASDLYALAVVAFEALTGRRPFQAQTMADYAELHYHGKVPPLGASFPPALDRMFQRALAKRPEDRWGTALELAAALRAASGIGTTRADLPRLDQDVRDAWLAEAPQPLAESMAELDDARNAYQARDIAKSLILTLVRYLLAMALAMNARSRDGGGDPALLELLRAMSHRVPSMDRRTRLLRLLVHRLARSPGPPPVPELLDLLTPPPGGPDVLERIHALYAADHAITEEMARLQLLRLIPELSHLLRRATFVLDYLLVVPHNHAPERWTGRRCQPRTLAYLSGGELVDGHPMLLDREGRVCIDLWPLVQAVTPTEAAEPELLLFDCQGPHGALLIAAPSGFKYQDAIAEDWVATHVIAELESKTRMRGQLGLAAYRWWNPDWPHAPLWRSKLLLVAVMTIVFGLAALVLYL